MEREFFFVRMSKPRKEHGGRYWRIRIGIIREEKSDRSRRKSVLPYCLENVEETLCQQGRHRDQAGIDL